MPELPEVEVTRRGISGHLIGDSITRVRLGNDKLAAALPAELAQLLVGATVRDIERRGKYLIFRFDEGALLLHLGMTGHLRLVRSGRPAGKHDLFDLEFASGLVLRLNDTRHFGSIRWTTLDPLSHRLLSHLGPEPLTEAFTGDYLYRRSRGKRVALQRFLMDGTVVAGVGNIYAAESLFRCGMAPTRLSGELDEADFGRLVQAVKEVLTASVAVGTQSMDFRAEEEKLAYFPQTLMVYDREGEPCRVCGSPIVRGRMGNRSTYYCERCQKQ